MTSTEVIAESKTSESPVTTTTNDATQQEAKVDPAAEKDSANTNATSPKKEPAPPKPKVHKKDFEKDTVYLYQFPRSPTIPSVSPFCLKVETFLRATGIQYENVENRLRYKSKKGQLPFIELNGEEIADSDIILKELSKKFEKDLNDGLTSDQRIASHAFEAMLNNHTSWVVRWWRYTHPDEFLETSQLDIKKTLDSKIPAPFLKVLFKWGFKRNISSAVGHGIGTFTPEEALEKGKEDLKALSTSLGTQDYFFGKEIHQLDIVAFAHVAQFVFVPISDLLSWIEQETPNLISFVNRIKEKYWPDWDEICQSLDINTHLPKKELTPEQLEEQKKAEEKKAEEEKKKEEKKKEKEEKKRQKEEEKRKKQEEKERKKKEAEEAKAKAKAEAEAAKAAAAAAAAESAKSEDATASSAAPAAATEGASSDAEKKTEDASAKEEPAKDGSTTATAAATEATEKKE